MYHFLSYDDKEFIGFASIDDNFTRTISCYCPGKLFCATGWQVGWAVGPSHLIKPIQLITYASVYCSNTPISVAFARSLDKAHHSGYSGDLSYIENIRKDFQEVRDYMVKALSTESLKLPVETLKSESGYFVLLDVSKCKDLIPERYTKSHEFEVLKEG